MTVAGRRMPRAATPAATVSDVRLGLRENAGQFGLLVVVDAFVGAAIGVERTAVPLLAERAFGLTGATAWCCRCASATQPAMSPSNRPRTRRDR